MGARRRRGRRSSLTTVPFFSDPPLAIAESDGSSSSSLSTYCCSVLPPQTPEPLKLRRVMRGGMRGSCSSLPTTVSYFLLRLSAIAESDRDRKKRSDGGRKKRIFFFVSAYYCCSVLPPQTLQPLKIGSRRMTSFRLLPLVRPHPLVFLVSCAQSPMKMVASSSVALVRVYSLILSFSWASPQPSLGRRFFPLFKLQTFNYHHHADAIDFYPLSLTFQRLLFIIVALT
jgi:hypothetical protein